MLGLTLKIEELRNVQPKDFQSPETSNVAESDGGAKAYQASRDHYLDVGRSELRGNIANSQLQGAKYSGVKTSRELLAQGYDSNQSDSISIRSRDEEVLVSIDRRIDRSPAATDYDEEEESDGDASSQTHSEPRQNHGLEAQGLTSALRESRMADREKGKAIINQSRLWDSIVDARIKIQKAAGNANVLPHPSATDSYRTISENAPGLVYLVLQAGLDLSEDLFALEEALARADGIAIPARKRRKFDHSAEAISSQALSQRLAFATEAFTHLEASLHIYHVQTLEKWSTKVQSAASSALPPSKHASFRLQNIAPKSTVELIAEALAEGSVRRAKVVGRTRVRRGQIQPRLGLNDKGDVSLDFGSLSERGVVPREGDAEVFDDTDFYQEMLRDVIYSKSENAGTGAGELGAMRPKKTKKAVDTKASKGRKLRYEVHEKLQNFMVPVPLRRGWHDEQIDELFASLMGKGAPRELVGEETRETAAVALGGLRVF